MALQTDLSRSPYFDDYDVNKNFYRVLYRPSVAVQARELNQMQTILQDQIDKFGRNIFKEGSVTEGCAFTFDDKYNYVKINDTYANGAAFTITDFQDKVITNGFGLRAIVHNTVAGFITQDPDLNTLYVKYINSVTNNGITYTAFSNNDNLVVTTQANVAVGNLTVATVTNSTGVGYAFTTTAGTIYKKGFFISVQPQTLIVSKYDNMPDGISVGFDATENIITPEADSSLYDNAAGSPNYAAPGAHRLQLIPTLVTRYANNISNTSSFFSLCDFKSGKPVSIKNDPQYALLGAQIAQRTYETNGNYVVYPFVLSTEAKAANDALNSTYVNLVSSAGLGYVEGYRVQYVNNNKINLRRSTDYDTVKNVVVSANYGYYINVNNFCGEFNTDQLYQVELHSVAKTAVTSGTLLSTGYSSSTRIGTAYLRGFMFSSGNIGSGSDIYTAYLFDVQMNPGKNFSAVKSIINYQSSAVVGVADVIQTYDSTVNANISKIQSAQFNNMIYPFGQKALKENGFNNTQYVYRDKKTSSFGVPSLSGGAMSFTLSSADGTATESFNVSGTLSPAQTTEFLVVPTVSGYTSNYTGTVSTSGNTVTGSSDAAFLSHFVPGDYISIGGSNFLVTFVANNTSLNTIGSVSGSGSFAKAFPAGVPIDFTRGNRSVVISGTTATFTLNETLSASFNAKIYYDVLRSSTVAIKKQIKKNVIVQINCASHSATTNGPYSLGFPDVYKINAIYLNEGTYSNSGINLSSAFKFDNGQRDNYYDLATITPISANLDANTRIYVDMQVFTYDQSSGKGFFTANSYPIDNANTANTTAIQTAAIPQYTATDGSIFDLRDCVDFRPFAANTANPAANSSNFASTATTNPSGTLTFSLSSKHSSSGTYLPTPNQNFESDIQHYLSRIDKAVIKTNGDFIIVEGNPSNSPIPPVDQPGAMTLGIITVPPYPSLATPEANDAKRYDYAITNSITQIKRYTMKDIGVLSNKIDNLEYYTSLSLLETQAKNTLVRSSATGQNRFQNGILVDPFRGHDIGNTLDPNYNIAIDTVKSELRPFFDQFRRPMKYSQDLSTNTVKKGNAVLLNYTETQYISQNYASKYRNCIEGNIYVWSGEINFIPPGDTQPDLTKSPDVVNNIDLASNFVNISAAYGTQWGNWQTTSSATDSKIAGTDYSSVTDSYGNIINTTSTQTATTTNTQQQRAGTQLAVTTSTNQYNVGTFVTDVSTLPYVKSIAVTVIAHGLKPGSRVYGFINNIDVNHYLGPANSSYVPSGNLGDPLIVDSNGNLYAQLIIPPNTFRSTTLEMNLYDVPNPVTGIDAITTKATGNFYGSNISIAKGSSILNAREAVVSVQQVTDQQTITQTVVTSNSSVVVIPAPAPPEPPYNPYGDSIPAASDGNSYDGGGGCCFDPDTKVLMADGSWKKISDILEGEQVIGSTGNVNTVTGTKSTTVQDRMMKKIKGYDFFATDDHLFLTNNGWKTWRPDRLIINNRENAVFLEGENRYTPLNDKDILTLFKDGKVTSVPYSELEIEDHIFNPDFVVHDLHLDGDQSYIVEEFVVHNCGGGGCGCCFDPEASVLMADKSLKKIKDVEIGDLVVGYGGQINKVVNVKTTTVNDRPMKGFNGFAFATDDHLFLTINGWKTFNPQRVFDNNLDVRVYLTGENKTTPLNENDSFVMMGIYEHNEISMSSLSYKDLDVITEIKDNDYVVYDLTLDGNHTYVVEGFVVHNCDGCSCFLAGSLITMADGSVKVIEDVKVGEYVLGAFGEHNIILGKDNVVLGNRSMYKINSEHDTAGDHPHVSKDKKFYSFEVDAIYKEWGGSYPVILENDEIDILINKGLNKDRVHQLELGVELKTVDSSKVVEEILVYDMPPETKLYNFVVGGSHTYFVNGYAVTGWPREDDFDYDKWESKGIQLTLDDYRINTKK